MTVENYLVKGSDPILRDRLVRELVEKLLGADDIGLALEEFVVPGKAASVGGSSVGGGSESGDSDNSAGGDRPPGVDKASIVARVVAAATTPPFGTERRIVVLREVGALNTADAGALVEYLGNPMETTVLVLVVGGGTIPAPLVKAFKASGTQEISGGSAQPNEAIGDLARAAGVALSASATRRISEHVGEDAGRLPAILQVLAGAFGSGAKLEVDEVEPYLAEAGAVPVYLLARAIDAGDHIEALVILDRLRSAGNMHPLQVMGLLHRHFERLLRLDHPDIMGEADAVAALDGKVKPYPAKLAWQQARRLGSDGIRQGIELLGRADLDLRGATAIPENAVLEVLVTRLAGLARRAGAISVRGAGR